MLAAAAIAARGGLASAGPLAAALQQASRSMTTYHHMDKNTERGEARGDRRRRGKSDRCCWAARHRAEHPTPLAHAPTDKKERDPTFRQAPKDVAASEQRAGSQGCGAGAARVERGAAPHPHARQQQLP